MTIEALAALGHDLAPAAHRRLSAFVERLLEENTRVNLTGTRAPEAFWAQHVCDSLGVWALLRRRPPKRIVDLGTGGGLPGLVLACLLPSTGVTLIDATRKKLDALERIASALALRNTRCLWGRAEQLAHDPRLREHASVLTARAVAPLPTLCELAAGFVRPSGRLLFMKSVTAAEEERRAAARAAGLCGLRFRTRHAYALPAPHGERVVLEYVKRKPLQQRYPRGPGVPEKSPL